MLPYPLSNQQCLEYSQQFVWHPCTQMQQHGDINSPAWLPLLAIARGKGAWLYDFSGNRYLDGISSWWTNLFGHANAEINAAITQQLNSLEHVMLAGFTHEGVVRLSEQLSELCDFQLGHAFYASDGASATEIALKMSTHYWRNRGLPNKNRFICLEGSYHGETVGALAVTDIDIFKNAYSDLVRSADTLPNPDARQAEAGQSDEEVAELAAERLEEYLQENHQNIAALIVEPLVQCASGMAMYHPIYLSLAKQICVKYQVLLIADEIAVGFGRTGSFFAYQQAGIVPDILCLSKGLSGGYLPLSVVLSSDEIYQQFYSPAINRAFLHSHSYTGNPLACSAALASLAIFANNPVLATNQQKSKQLMQQIDCLHQHPAVKNLRQCGTIIAFDVISNDPYFARKFYRAALENQALIRPLGNTIYLMPPYILNEEEINHLAQALLKSLSTALAI